MSMDRFASGATRDSDVDKLDGEGFFSPLVMLRRAQYMHEHRRQADGVLRDSDNWQKGIPRDRYMKSMWRHFLDVHLHHRGLGFLATDTLQNALCALAFNVDGYLFELLQRPPVPEVVATTDPFDDPRGPIWP